MLLLAGSLVIGYQIDSLQYFLSNYAAQTFDYAPLYWVSGAIPIVIAILVTSLAWFVLVRNRVPWVVSIVYIAVGLATAFFPLWFFGLRIQFVPFNVTPLAQSLTSHMGQIGAFSAIIGLVGAVLNLGKRRFVSVA
ncbi:MAG TPA: hypothetical protein PLC98_24625 [Anaerolineales bacterium]|nr:hypothetical protein [Anaerolineales bacterium]